MQREKKEEFMKKLHQSENSRRFIVAVAVLTSVALFRMVEAVVPPPDGGYPGFNTAEGQKALFSRTTGIGDTAVGWYSLFSNTDGSFNTGVGAATLIFNVGNQSTGDGLSNTAVGTAALLFNITGSDNTAVGTAALVNNDADGNTAFGAFALNGNTTGFGNTAIGTDALLDNLTGNFNTATGFGALVNNTTNANTANGALALQNNTDGFGNTGIGGQALQSNEDGDHNTATGFQSLLFNLAGENTASGYQALMNNVTGDNNTATGSSALGSCVSGHDNVATGYQALFSNDGNANTAVGYQALLNNTAGSLNVAIGGQAGNNVTTASDVICIGAAVGGENVDASCYIGNIFGVTSSGGTAVFVNSNNKLGTATSSRRFKEQIKPLERASEALFALKPVSFRYKDEIDPAGTSQFGLVAEEVEKVNPDLIVRDKEGKPYSVRYDQVNAMLLNEFLKEHRKVEKLETTVAQQWKDFQGIATEQKREIQALAETVREQTAQIQKVNARLEVTESRSRTVLNDPQNY
jgi:hypothetical protein